MVSIGRYIRNIRRTGPMYYLREMISGQGDAKSGTFMGKDSFGNKYFENLTGEEVPGRHRWVDFARGNADWNISQVPPEWHSWLNHIRGPPPPQDAILRQSTPKWLTPHRDNLTATRAAYKPFSTTRAKIGSWEGEVRARE